MTLLPLVMPASVLLSVFSQSGGAVKTAPAPGQAAQSGAPAAASGASADPAAEKMMTFHLEADALDYSYPAGFQNMASMAQSAMQEQAAKAEGPQKTAMQCTSLPVMAVDAGGSAMRMVMLMRMDGACRGESIKAGDLATATQQIMSQSMAQFGAPTIGKSADFEIAGHSASTVYGTVTGKLGEMHSMATCVLSGKDTVCWDFITNACAELGRMAAYPVVFAGKPAEAVVPARLLPACAAAK